FIGSNHLLLITIISSDIQRCIDVHLQAAVQAVVQRAQVPQRRRLQPDALALNPGVLFGAQFRSSSGAVLSREAEEVVVKEGRAAGVPEEGALLAVAGEEVAVLRLASLAADAVGEEEGASIFGG